MNTKLYVEVVTDYNSEGIHKTETITYEWEKDGWYIYEGDDRRKYAHSDADSRTVEQLIRKEFSELY